MIGGGGVPETGKGGEMGGDDPGGIDLGNHPGLQGLAGAGAGRPLSQSSLERRGSSRTFRYGYLVTTSSQSLAPPSTAPSPEGLGHRLQASPTFMT